MENSSRTPEGDPTRCPVCGKPTRIEPSTVPTVDAPCPHCGSLLWFANNPRPSFEETHKVVSRLLEEVAQRSAMRLTPAAFYAGFLQRLLAPIAAPAGAVWLWRTPGALELQAGINMGQVGLDRTPSSRQMHDELLRQAARKGQADLVWPRSMISSQDQEGLAAVGNPTDHVILFAPILVGEQLAGLVEVWQDPARSPEAQRGFLQFVKSMADLATGYASKSAVEGA
jgi:hypothetical protein